MTGNPATEIGDYIRDAGREGAFGTVTDLRFENGKLIATYTMDVFQSADYRQAQAARCGTDGWQTDEWQIVGKPLVETADDARYYDAVTQ